MPKGVEHCVRMPVSCVAACLREPQMPKGVEHVGAPPARSAQAGLREPQMPKGVEHPDCAARQPYATAGLREPQMPKGVEHSLSPPTMAAVALAARTSDAERR